MLCHGSTGLIRCCSSGWIRCFRRSARPPAVLFSLPALKDLLDCTEALANLARPFNSGPAARVQAVALNTFQLIESAARQVVCDVREELNLPCTDPIRWSAEPPLEAVRRS